MFSNIDLHEFVEAFIDTMYMSLLSTLFVFCFGLILGITLFFIGEKGVTPNKVVYQVTSISVNLLRSIPFLILIVLLIPFTRIIIGTILGPSAAIPALIIGATPYYARLIELALNEKGEKLIETGKAFGASNFQIIVKIILPESITSIIRGITTTAIMITGYTSIAGAIGAGGLGNLAYLYGFARNRTDVTLAATLGIILIILFIQFAGDITVKKLDKN
ncbi:Methionine import system permease protein MetP [Candidatus Izimaplasma bacterium HR1]|jgi:D-methionine transport system permease protein|uniref:methionine ABC transporter permease n=1 Tax=Candidatus Izimoplasma sp. HR1 TaxID=1541959 RepID=UPI0004F762CC|nr:Methionine import system permease protein MetP [Candidatus Izimaplasma bacterium HR1]